MLENAIKACPETIWGDRTQQPEFWYIAYHVLFFLDYGLTEPTLDFAPPAPFGLEEMDPAGVMPPRVYTQAELLRYLEHGRSKMRQAVAALTAASAAERLRGVSFEGTRLETLLYNLRHVQHHAAQLNLLLRQRAGFAPRWVGRD